MENTQDVSWSAISDLLAEMDKEIWNEFRAGFREDTAWIFDRLLIFLIFVFFLLSNIFAYMLRIYNNSRPDVDVNIVNMINMYFVEMINLTVVFLSGPQLWVSIFSPLPFSLAYILGLVPHYLGYVASGLAGSMGVIKMLIVIQVKIHLKTRKQIQL